MSLDRRSATRYQFIAEAEVYEIETDTKLRAKTGDLSLGGCFLDMLNPSPQNSEVRVTIVRDNGTFSANARVVFVVPNLGMGVIFMCVDADQHTTLEKWIAELKARQVVA